MGDPAPPFKLPALRGGEVDLNEFAGRLLVVIFWSPVCGFCRELAPALVARDSEATEESAQIVFVASGTREANEAEGFASPVLLEASGALGRAYGVGGTPTAILVDAESRVGSGLAAGRAEIEALLRRADAMSRAARAIHA